MYKEREFQEELESSQSSRRTYTFLNEETSKTYINKQLVYGSIIIICLIIELIILYYSPKLLLLNSIVVLLGGINCFITIALISLFGVLLFSNTIRLKEAALSHQKILRVLSFTPLAIYIAICVQSLRKNGISVYLAIMYHIFTGIHTGIMGSTYNYAYLYWMQILKVELPEFRSDDVLKEYD